MTEIVVYCDKCNSDVQAKKLELHNTLTGLRIIYTCINNHEHERTLAFFNEDEE